MRQVRQQHVFIVSVGKESNELAAQKLQSYGEVESVELLAEGESIKVILKNESRDGSMIPERLIQEGFKLRRFQGRGNQPRRRVHANYEGDYELVGYPLSPRREG